MPIIIALRWNLPQLIGKEYAMQNRPTYCTAKLLFISLAFLSLLPWHSGQNPVQEAETKAAKQPSFSFSWQQGNILVNRTPYFLQPNEQGQVFKATSAFSAEHWPAIYAHIEQERIGPPHFGLRILRWQLLLVKKPANNQPPGSRDCLWLHEI